MGVAQKLGADLASAWTSFGFGAEFYLQNNLTFYGILERSNGSDYSEDYRYSVDARYAFLCLLEAVRQKGEHGVHTMSKH